MRPSRATFSWAGCSRRALLLGLAGSLLAGRKAKAAARRRIVSIGGAMTEIVFALGEGDAIVAVDTTSAYPTGRTDPLPKVGYLRQLAAEGILSMKPDLILADHDSGPATTLQQLQDAGIDLRQFPMRPTADAVAAKIVFVGAALERQSAAQSVADAYQADLAALRGWVAPLADRPKVLFLLNAGTTGLRGAGSNTGADDMISLSGGSNVFAGASGYQTVSAESALAADPDYLLLMQQTLDEMGGVSALKALPQLANLRAAKEERVITMHGAYLLGFGPRTAHAARDLAAALHPGAALPALPARAWVG